MKFIFADAQDMIDPNYDFLNDEFSPNRILQRTDKYPHEVFEQKPYDGMLLSRGLIDDGVYKSASRAYSAAQSRRMKLEGIKRFLRYYSNGFRCWNFGKFPRRKIDVILSNFWHGFRLKN